jgi:hypothetical protein
VQPLQPAPHLDQDLFADSVALRGFLQPVPAFKLLKVTPA